MAWVLKAHISVASPDSNTVTSAAIDTTGADLLIVILADYGAVGASVFSDSKGNTWNTRQTQNNSAFCRGRLLDAKPGTVGAGHTFTATGAGTYPSFEVQAWSGSGATPFDQTNGANSAGVAVAIIATGSVTPSASGALIIAGLTNGGPTTVPNIDSSLTVGDHQIFTAAQCFGSTIASIVQGAAAAVNATWTWTGADFYASGLIATYLLAPAPPVITSPLTVSGTVGLAFTYQITASNTPTSYSATGLPAGLTVNTSTGAITGTPSAVGVSTVTIGATNGAGTGTATLTLTIVAAPITPASATRPGVGQAGRLQPAPFRVALLDAQGQLVETWRRWFLSSENFVNLILQTLLSLGGAKPSLMMGDDPDTGESGWVIPGPVGPQGPSVTGPQGSHGMDGDDGIGIEPMLAGPLTLSLNGVAVAPGSSVAMPTTGAADYVSGSWTPNDASGAGLSLSVTNAVYLKIGKLVHISMFITYPTTVSAQGASIGGLPFTIGSANDAATIGYSTAAASMSLYGSAGTTNLNAVTLGTGAAITNVTLSGASFVIGMTYIST